MGNSSISQALTNVSQPLKSIEPNWDAEPCDLTGDQSELQEVAEAKRCKLSVIIASKNILQGQVEPTIPRKKITPVQKQTKRGRRLTAQVLKQVYERIQNQKKKYSSFRKVTIDPSKFIKIIKSNIQNDFDWLEEIGSGSFGKVFKAKAIRNEELRAIKKIELENISTKEQLSLLTEFNIMKKIYHPNIIKLYDMYQDKRHLYVVTELCEGGSLLKFFSKYKISETAAKSIALQVLSVIKYLHGLNILHRDLKLENIVLVHKSQQYFNALPEIKVIDFGISVQLDKTEEKDIDSCLGSLLYMPPEALLGKAGLKWDIWSLGILIFILTTGRLPYKYKNNEELIALVLKGTINWQYTKTLSKELVNFLKVCLELQANLRASADQLLKHPWIREFKAPAITKSKRRQTIINLVNYNENKSKSNFVSTIQSYLSSKKTKQEERQKLASIFSAIDSNKDGIISRAELEQFCIQNSQVRYDDAIDQIFQSFDQNNINQIDFNYFILMMQTRNQMFDKQSLQEVFQFFDETKNGKLSKKLMKKVLFGVQNSEIEQIFSKIDSNKDEYISKQEFIEYLTANCVYDL